MKTILTIILTFHLFNPVVQAADTIELPEMGSSAGTVLSQEFEKRLGQSIMRQVRINTAVIQDPEIEAYIESIGYKLVANSDNNTIPFNFFVINDTGINAFAAPGGVVGVNSGVLLNSQSESELAGVMAHEIAHVTQRHMARTYERAGQIGLPMYAALIGAILVAIANPEAGQAALAVAMGANIQYQINFTRANEEEADNIGMQLLSRSGFDPYGMPGFFERLQQATKYYGRPPEFLSTHPLTPNRIAESQARAEQYPRVDYKDSINFSLVKAKLVVESHKDPRDSIKYFSEKLGTPDKESNIAARYGYVLALTKSGDYREAGKQLKLLLENDSENITYLLAAAKLEFEQGNYRTALGIYEKSFQLYPDYRPLIIDYTRALLVTEQPEKAIELLKNYNRFNETDLIYYNLLAQANAQLGDPIESGIAKAEHYYLSGETQLAIERLRYLQRNHQMDYYQQERVVAKLEYLEQELELEKKLKL